MSDFAPGDVVVCVDAKPRPEWVAYLGSANYLPLRLNAIYRVVGLSRRDGLFLAGHAPIICHDGELRGYDANRFRKLNDGTDDAELIERIRNCKPVREGVPA
jgi:hypothetical protein